MRKSKKNRLLLKLQRKPKDSKNRNEFSKSRRKLNRKLLSKRKSTRCNPKSIYYLMKSSKQTMLNKS